MAKTRTVRFKLETAETDAIQYKSYKPTLSPFDSLFVEVEVPDEHVLELLDADEDSAGGIVVTPAGLAYLLGELAHGMYRDNARRVTANSKRRD